MKKLLLFLMTMLLAACSAPMPGENVDEVQEALCSGPPIATGSVGSTATSPVVSKIGLWPAQTYSARVMLSDTTSGKISWGSTSDVHYRISGCVGFDGPCVTWPTALTTTLKLFSGTNADGSWFTSFYANGLKVAELAGAGANTSLQNTKTYSGGLTRIRQDTGTNSRFYFEGWNAGVWTSWSAKFFNDCGSVN